MRTPNAGQNSLFHRFCAKKPKKSKKFEAKFCKKHIFFSLHQKAGWLVFLEKQALFWGEWNSQPAYWCILIKLVFCIILLQISCFFKIFFTKKAENDYFKIYNTYTTFTPFAFITLQDDRQNVCDVIFKRSLRKKKTSRGVRNKKRLPNRK